MVATHYRLRKKSDIDFVYKHGRKVYQPLLGVVYCSGQTDVTRVTVIVSQRVAKHAVDRNKIKRRIRAALADRLPQLSASKGAPYDIIIIAQPKSRSVHHIELANELDALFTRAKVYAGN